MSTKKMATAAGVSRVVASADQFAGVLQFHHEALGVNKEAAMDLALRIDGLGAFLEKRAAELAAAEAAEEPKAEEPKAEDKKTAAREAAGNFEIAYMIPGKGGFKTKKFENEAAAQKWVEKFRKEEGDDVEVRWPSKTAARKAGFDASSIGKTVPGPIQAEADEPFMAGHFTQGDLSQLSKKQMSGELAAAAAAAAAAQKAASDASVALLNVMARFAEAAEEPKAEPAKAEEPKAETPKAAGEEPEAEEDDAAEAAKTASAFGLFARR